MGRGSEPPFARGETAYNGDILDLSDLTQLGEEIIEGRHYVFEDTIHMSGAEVHVKVVRNMGTAPIMPGQLLVPTFLGATVPSTSGSFYGVSVPWPSGSTGLPDEVVTWAPGDFLGRVNGLTTTAAQLCYIADELLPGGGVVQYDLFYVVCKGPVQVNLGLTGSGAIPGVAVGQHMVSNAYTGMNGTACPMAAYAGAQGDFNQLLHTIGVSLQPFTAVGSGATVSAPLLIYAHNKW